MHFFSLDFLIKLRMLTNDICLFLTIAKMGSVVVVVVVVVYLITNLVNVLSLFSFVTVHCCIFFLSSSFFVSLLSQIESSRKARSALENQLERLTREKVRVYRLIFWG